MSLPGWNSLPVGENAAPPAAVAEIADLGVDRALDGLGEDAAIAHAAALKAAPPGGFEPCTFCNSSVMARPSPNGSPAVVPRLFWELIRHLSAGSPARTLDASRAPFNC